MSKLSEKRVKFTHQIAWLILWAHDNLPGYRVALNEVKREPAQIAHNVATGKGIRMSLHALGLAADLILYIDGVYQRDTEAYRPLGEKWEELGGTWGGRFGDGNHFSLEHNGVK